MPALSLHAQFTAKLGAASEHHPPEHFSGFKLVCGPAVQVGNE